MTMTDNSSPDLEQPTIGGVRYDEYGLLIEDDEAYEVNTTNIKFVSEPVESQMWPDMPVPGKAKLSEIEAWLAARTEKFTTVDIGTELMYFATQYVKRFGPGHSNGFVKDVATKFADYEKLSTGQARGVLNVWRADCIYRAKQEVKAATAFGEAPDLYGTKIDLSQMVSGYYADPLHVTDQADSRLKVRINVTDHGIYVNDAAVYGQGTLYGVQRVGQKYYSGKVADVLERIVADPKSAMIAYGKLTNRCGRCHRPLEDEQSVRLGIGPICRDKLGW